MKLTHENFLRLCFNSILGLLIAEVIRIFTDSDIILILAIAVSYAIVIFGEYDLKFAKWYLKMWNLKD